MEKIKLTAYSHGAGCGCKISPAVLSDMLQNQQAFPHDQQLLIGNHSSDDAAVYDMGDGTGIISTTDFFMPIVDDPFTFGQIAAINALSDIFAMGGDPMMAIAIFGWPVNQLSADIAGEVLAGGRDVCSKVGSPLAGGHSIDSQEPIFGLAVTGKVGLQNLKRNDTAKEGAKLYLTKPLGVGILTTAEKKGQLKADHETIAKASMTTLNSIGKELGKIEGVQAMTDVTGFGLLGHLVEMCEGSQVSAKIDFEQVPVFSEAQAYVELGCVPGGTYRNWDSYGHHIQLHDPSTKEILCDPQTSGGLLIAVDEADQPSVEQILSDHGMEAQPIGIIQGKQKPLVEIS
jgi:selenide,water dikinase